MSYRKIITNINTLRQKSKLVTSLEEIKDIIKDLEDTLKDQRGIGLSAIQIGIDKQIAIIRYKDKKIDLVNSKIIEKEDRFKFRGEACLSLPGLYIDTSRYHYITFENGLDKRTFMSQDIESIAIQHEIDHQNGILIIDRKWRRR